LLQEGRQDSVSVEIGPILVRATATVGPGEDFDEALLRVLKERHPEEAAGLLSAITRLIEIESKQSGEGREDTIRRLVAGTPSPKLQMQTSQTEIASGSLLGSEFHGGGSETTSQQTVIRIGDQEYHSLDGVPAHLRPMVERGMSRAWHTRSPLGAEPKRPGLRLGCSWAVVSAVLRAWRA
jgi:hypothetical protein